MFATWEITQINQSVHANFFSVYLKSVSKGTNVQTLRIVITHPTLAMPVELKQQDQINSAVRLQQNFVFTTGSLQS